MMEETSPGWTELPHEEKLACIRAVVAQEVAPALERDGGGVDVIDLINGNQVMIAYRGACSCCPMALFGTLEFIQQIISVKIHPSLVVVPSTSCAADHSLGDR